MVDATNIIILLVYLAVIAVISFVAHRYSANHHDSFLLGDRSLNSFTAAISAGAADMSGWVLLGLPGAIYLSGLNQAWIVIGLVIGAYFNWVFISNKLRTTSKELNAITIPDFISKKVDGSSVTIRVVASIMIVIFFTMYVASGFVSGAKVFSQYFGMNYHMALMLTFVILSLATIIGGFLAVSWGEVFQGLIMVGIIIAIPILAFIEIKNTGGEIVNKALEHNINIFDMFYGTGIIGIISLLAWGLGYFGQPHILAKFMALKSPDIAKKARNIAMTWMILCLAFAVAIGILGAAVFANTGAVKDPELVMVILSNTLLSPWLIGLIIIAILSAVSSTANAQLLIISSVFTNDLKIVKKTVTMNRIIVVFVGLFAIYLGWDSTNRILSMVGYAWAGFGACFGPIMILSINMKQKLKARAGIAGIFSGGAVVILWNIFRKAYPDVELLQLYELLPAFLISMLCILVFNLGAKNTVDAKNYH